MARIPILTYDRGTLILHPPPRGKDWMDYATWDDRVERFRIPAWHYSDLLRRCHASGTEITDQAKTFRDIELVPRVEMEPYAHQREALEAWQHSQRRGVVVLPTAAGKTYLAQLAMQATQCRTLILVPTLDLMHQWYAHLTAAFPDAEIGLLGGGSRDRTAILISTYDSAAIHAETLGNQYALLVFDECHHLPSDFNRVIAEYAIAPYRLGLTATPERSDGKHADLDTLIGPEVYRKRAEDLAGSALANHEAVQIKVRLSTQERDRYDQLIAQRNAFLQNAKIFLGSVQGWQRFVQASAQSKAGRRAMLAHREARAIAFGTEGKLRVLADLLANHHPDRILVFTDDNATVYRISQEFLLPAITHQTGVKERHEILTQFKQGDYRTLVASRVLNEGVDVPDAKVAIVLSGTGSTREHIQRLGRVLRRGSDPNKVARLYEVIAEDTNEENVSRRRHNQPYKSTKKPAAPQLELVPPPYAVPPSELPRVAERSPTWNPAPSPSSPTVNPDDDDDW
jgi:superfamily II DNA or RNA helicase